jgi:hypothetical protein
MSSESSGERRDQDDDPARRQRLAIRTAGEPLPPPLANPSGVEDVA